MPITHGDKIKNLRVGIADMENISLAVGWYESAKYDDDTPVASVAAQNEFGNPAKGIPPRPFFRPTISENKSDWAKLAGQGARAVMLGNETGDSVAEKMGLLISGQVRAKIAQIHEPPLSPRTIAGRLAIRADKSTIGALDKPLVFEGIMLNSLTYATIATQPDLFK